MLLLVHSSDRMNNLQKYSIITDQVVVMKRRRESTTCRVLSKRGTVQIESEASQVVGCHLTVHFVGIQPIWTIGFRP